jgi:hypothetical protein
MHRDLTIAAARAHPRPGRCFRCEKIIDESKEFRDKISFMKYKQFGLCQPCQDVIFTEDYHDK